MATDPLIIKEAVKLRSIFIDKDSVKPVPVVKVAGNLGYRVSEFIPTVETKDISGAVDHGEKIIFVNATDSPGRKRFTIAHELGHIVLDGADANHVDYRHQMGYTDGQQSKERDANMFATELLMPRHIFEALWSAYEGNISYIADALLISKEATKNRASRLHLL